MPGSIERTNGAAAYRRAAASSVLKPVNSVAPSISGTLTVGSTLTAAAGTWSNTPTYEYQWLRAGAVISGATASTYILVIGDSGAAISVRVTAVSSGGFRSETVTSAATAAIT